MSTACAKTPILALLIALGFAGFPATSFADHSWGNYHWARKGNPFTLMVGDNVGNALANSPWFGYLTTASNDWSLSKVLETQVGTGNVSNPKNCKATSGRVEVCATTYGFNGWLGVAQIWISGGHITQGIVKLNDTYFNTAKYNLPAWRNLVMCQEVGHTFGLDHQDENFNNPPLGSCMDYTSDPESNQHPNAHDYEQLEHIYAHLDGTTTVGGTSGSQKGKVPPPFANIDSDEPVEVGTGQWGRLIRSTNGGRTELFELDLGGGRKVFTHVLWADPEDESEPGSGRGRR